MKHANRELAVGELRRMRERYAEGMPMTEMVKLHRLHQRLIEAYCADVERPQRPARLKRQAPVGLTRGFD